MIAGLLLAAVVVSCVLAVIGLIRRAGWFLLFAGLLGLIYSWAGMMSIGRFILLIPLLEIASGVGYLVKARTTILWLLSGVACALYVAQLVMVL